MSACEATQVICGARGGRTLTVSLPTDFKSVASADSAIAPTRMIFYYNIFVKQAFLRAENIFVSHANSKSRMKRVLSKQKTLQRQSLLSKTTGGPDGIRTRDLGLDRAAC